MKLFWNTNNQSSSFWGDYHQKNSKTWIYELLENIEFVEIDDLSKIDSKDPASRRFLVKIDVFEFK